MGIAIAIDIKCKILTAYSDDRNLSVRDTHLSVRDRQVWWIETGKWRLQRWFSTWETAAVTDSETGDSHKREQVNHTHIQMYESVLLIGCLRSSADKYSMSPSQCMCTVLRLYIFIAFGSFSHLWAKLHLMMSQPITSYTKTIATTRVLSVLSWNPCEGGVFMKTRSGERKL